MAIASWTEVLEFWFGVPDSPEFGRPRAAWFVKSAAFDAEIRDRFLATHEAAAAGTLDGWGARPLGALALVVVLDQFPRNLFRGSAEAFASDAHALTLARRLVLGGRMDLALTPTQRVFLYLPFEHAESLDAQDHSVALFEGLRDQPAHARPNGTIDYAWRHRAVIAQFGRFPHRNATLGRESTPAELTYLSQPGAGF
jgi:uncharacterized protein (DUF924 family)